jgi:DNA-binding transcriptional LysR family regulator
LDLFSRAARYFDAVAKEGSVRAAAKVINVAPSAINKHVIELERDVGVPLFERTPQGLKLTAAGEILVHRLRLWRSDSSRTREMIGDLRSLRRGHIRIATVEGPMDFLLDIAVAQFRERYPNIGVDIDVGSSSEVVTKVEQNVSEIGLAFNPSANSTARIVASAFCKVGAVMSPDHPLSQHKEVRINHLVDLPIGIPSLSTSLHSVIEIAEERSSVKLWRASRSTSIVALKQMARTPPFVAILSDVDIYGEMRTGTLVHRPLVGHPFSKHVLAVLAQKNIANSVAAETFLVHLTQMFRETFPDQPS